MPPRTPDCGHPDESMYLHSRCHPRSPTWVELHATGPSATVSCAECGALIAQLTARPAGEPFGAQLVLT